MTTVATPIADMETLFRALADQTRLRILALLASGEVCVCNIHGALGVPQPTASRHLAYLRRAGLVAKRRDGLWVHYRLEMPADPAMASVLRTAVEAVGNTRSLGTDRRRLSGLTSIPLRLLEDAANCCVSSRGPRVRRS